MSLYKPLEEQTLTVEIKQEEDKILLDFSSDCGKFGTIEPLASYKLTPVRLLLILSEADLTDEEIN